MEFNVYDLLLEDERTTVNEIVLEAVARKFDIDINDFDYDILGYITTVDGKVKLLQSVSYTHLTLPTIYSV